MHSVGSPSTSKLRRKLTEYVKRYGAAQLISLIAGVSLSPVAYSAVGTRVGAAFFGSMVETVVFYGVMVYRDVRQRMQRERKEFGVMSVLKVARNMVLEFGLGEYTDSLLIRPFLFSVFPLFISNYPVAIFVGTIVADVTYYLPVIGAYELRKKY